MSRREVSEDAHCAIDWNRSKKDERDPDGVGDKLCTLSAAKIKESFPADSRETNWHQEFEFKPLKSGSFVCCKMPSLKVSGKSQVAIPQDTYGGK